MTISQAAVDELVGQLRQDAALVALWHDLRPYQPGEREFAMHQLAGEGDLIAVLWHGQEHHLRVTRVTPGEHGAVTLETEPA